MRTAKTAKVELYVGQEIFHCYWAATRYAPINWQGIFQRLRQIHRDDATSATQEMHSYVALVASSRWKKFRKDFGAQATGHRQ
jgi:hypothetical protein